MSASAALISVTRVPRPPTIEYASGPSNERTTAFFAKDSIRCANWQRVEKTPAIRGIIIRDVCCEGRRRGGRVPFSYPGGSRHGGHPRTASKLHVQDGRCDGDASLPVAAFPHGGRRRVRARRELRGALYVAAVVRSEEPSRLRPLHDRPADVAQALSL